MDQQPLSVSPREVGEIVHGRSLPWGAAHLQRSATTARKGERAVPRIGSPVVTSAAAADALDHRSAAVRRPWSSDGLGAEPRRRSRTTQPIVWPSVRASRRGDSVRRVGRTQRSISGDRELDEMIQSMRDLLVAAVADTLESGSPQPARDRVARIIEIDDEVAAFDPGTPPGQTIALVALSHWLVRPPRGDAARPDPEHVLDWIAQHLGPRYRARARYMIGMLDAGRAHEAASLYADALGDDFLPTLIWIVAALTDLHGDGDPGWLTGDPQPGVDRHDRR